MPDADLLLALKQAKAKKMFFAFVPKGADGKLIVSKTKIPPKLIVEAKKEIGGGTPVTGKCFGNGGTMVFQVAKPAAPTLAAAIKKVAKRDAGMTLDADVQLAGDADADEQDTGAAATGASPAAPPTAHGQANVTGIQKALQKLGYDPGKIDGIMGPHTQAAIKKFQQANGLAADGIMGAKTQAALAKALQGGAVPAGGKPAQPTPAPAQTAPASSGGGAGPAPSNVKTLPVPAVNVKPGNEPGQLLAVAESLDSIQPIQGAFPDGAHYHITIGGKQVEINQQEVDTNRKNAQAAFAKAVKAAQRRSSDALDFYNIYRSTMTEGTINGAITWLFDTFAVEDPGGQVRFLCTLANGQAAAALAAANGNSFVTAANALIAADTAAHKAHALIVAYKDGIESAAETTVSVLEDVKTASEITLAVGGAVVTGGATVAVVGGVGMTAAEDVVGPALAGDKVDWGKFVFDEALNIVLHKLAPGEQIEKAVLEKLGTRAVEKVGVKAAHEAFAKVLATEGEVLLTQSVKATQKALSGKAVTADQFVEETKKEYYKQLAIEAAKALLKK